MLQVTLREPGRLEVGEASVIAWSPDDRSLAAGSGTGAVNVFRAG